MEATSLRGVKMIAVWLEERIIALSLTSPTFLEDFAKKYKKEGSVENPF